MTEIAKGVFGEKVPFLEFNLSQFEDSDNLIGAFHQVRDKVLSRVTPIVFWDEFDSGNHDWLRYFLAPMQDGQFLEGQVTHFIGKCVFIFAGGVSHSFKQFNDLREGINAADFKLKKRPDFISRLSGYLNIAGPNRRNNIAGGPPDNEFPVRRAMVIRTALQLKDRPLQIERGLLTALLSAGSYKNGARSLQKLVQHIKDSGGFPLRRAYLPPDDILSLYVDNVESFHDLTKKYDSYYQQADLLAPIIHNIYLKGSGVLFGNRIRSKPVPPPH